VEKRSDKYTSINFQANKLKEKAKKKILNPRPRREIVRGGGSNMYNNELAKNQVSVGNNE